MLMDREIAFSRYQFFQFDLLNAISIKTSASHVMHIDEVILRFIWRGKDSE